MLFDINPHKIRTLDPLYIKFLDGYKVVTSIEAAFKRNKEFLDPDFERYFGKDEYFLPKLWELTICDALTKSKYTKFIKKTNGKGPDFCLSKILDDKDVHIECVCPNLPTKDSVHNFSFQVNHPKYCLELPVIEMCGVDERIIARYGSSISDKAIKFNEKYKYTQSHYRVLCVSGARLGRWKSELHESESIFSTRSEFEYCIYGELVCSFPKKKGDKCCTDFDYRSFTIQKGDTPLYYGLTEVSAFNAVVFRDYYPIDGWTLTKNYIIYYREDASPELINLLNEIFHE